MAIVQEDRLDAPRPEVDETEYGAQYVTAATETPVTEAPATESVDNADEAPVKAERPKRKTGRPRKK